MASLGRIAVVAGLVASSFGCGSSAALSSGSAAPGATAPVTSAGTAASATIPPSALASVVAVSCAGLSATLPHQVPAFEALLPERVAGRTLSRWSVAGRCWVEMALNGGPTEVDRLIAIFEDLDETHDLDLTHLQYGVAGRSDTKADPPYFVFAASRPDTEDEIDFSAYMLFGGARFKEPLKAQDLTRYSETTVAGKTVFVGTSEMLRQDEHQRGLPYLYQTDDQMFLLITDDATWATEAIGQLP